ncbi:hypothetical protein Dimus_013828 [Dionaea muscipula]
MKFRCSAVALVFFQSVVLPLHILGYAHNHLPTSDSIPHWYLGGLLLAPGFSDCFYLFLRSGEGFSIVCVLALSVRESLEVNHGELGSLVRVPWKSENVSGCLFSSCSWEPLEGGHCKDGLW